MVRSTGPGLFLFAVAVLLSRADLELARGGPPVASGDAKAHPPKQKPDAPAAATEKVVKQLPSSVSDVAVGGGGRYLILSLPRVRKLAVFDVTQAKIVHYISLPADDVKFAAGMDKLMVVLPRNQRVERWSLATLQREKFATLPFKEPVRTVLMGSASDGPLAVNDTFLDIHTLKPLPIKHVGNAAIPGGEGVQVRVSADGTVFGSWTPNVSPQGIHTRVLLGNELKEFYQHDSAGHVVPGPDGKVIYTARGLYTAEVKALDKNSRNQDAYCLPAESGSFYLCFKPGDPLPRPETPAGYRVSVCMVGDARPLVTLDSLELGVSINSWDREGFTADKRIHFMPDARLIVSIPETNDRLYLYPFDVIEALEKSDIDYLLVTSQPPPTAARGKLYTYAIAVKSRKGGIKYRVDSGPDGMKVSSAGKLSWSVPADFDEDKAEVILGMSDRTGQEVFQAFSIGILAPPAAEPDSPRPKKKPAETSPAEPAEEGPAPSLHEEAGSLKPPPLDADRVVKALPSRIVDVVAGGGGRYLILYLARMRKLAIFDVSQARIVHYIALAEDDVKFAAGMSKLMVVLPGKNIIQRWDLATGTREVSASLAVSGPVIDLCMGSASDGPLLVAQSGSVRGEGSVFLDPMTLRTIALDDSKLEMPGVVPGLVRAAADGSVFAMRSGADGEPHDVHSVIVAGRHAQVHGTSMAPSVLVPGPDGKFIYTMTGTWTSELQLSYPGDIKQTDKPYVPALQGPYFMQLDPAAGTRPGHEREETEGGIAFYVTGYERPLTTLQHIEGVNGERVSYGHAADRLNHDKRVFFIPDANLLITIPQTNDRLVLHHFAVEDALKKWDVKYLIVTSRPPLSAQPGAPWKYPIRARARQGGITYRLDSGPPGMDISSKGLLTWDVPSDWKETETDVIVSIGDRSGQERFHTFRIAILPRHDSAADDQPRPAPSEKEPAIEKVPSK